MWKLQNAIVDDLDILQGCQIYHKDVRSKQIEQPLILRTGWHNHINFDSVYCVYYEMIYQQDQMAKVQSVLSDRLTVTNVNVWDK